MNFRKRGAVHFEYTRSVALEEGKAKALKKKGLQLSRFESNKRQREGTQNAA